MLLGHGCLEEARVVVGFAYHRQRCDGGYALDPKEFVAQYIADQGLGNWRRKSRNCRSNDCRITHRFATTGN
jgi:hypothetical protein